MANDAEIYPSIIDELERKAGLSAPTPPEISPDILRELEAEVKAAGWFQPQAIIGF